MILSDPKLSLRKPGGASCRFPHLNTLTKSVQNVFHKLVVGDSHLDNVSILNANNAYFLMLDKMYINNNYCTDFEIIKTTSHIKESYN